MDENKQTLKEATLFLSSTFLISWFFWMIIILANRNFDALWYGEALTWIPLLAGSLGPAFGAYIICQQSHRESTLKSFLQYAFNLKINRKAGILSALFILWRFVMVWLAFGIQEPVAILYLFLNLPLFIIGGGLEELGWRGYLQPKVEKMTGYVLSTLITGLIWSLWHLPLWFISGTVQSALPFAAYTLLAVILSFSFTALYKYTENIFLVVLNHAWFNGCIGLAVYIGADGFLQLDLNWKVYFFFIAEFILALILGMIKKSKQVVAEE